MRKIRKEVGMALKLAKRHVVKKKSPSSGNVRVPAKKTVPEAPSGRGFSTRTKAASHAPKQVEQQGAAEEVLPAPVYTEKDAKKRVGDMSFIQISNKVGLPMDSERFAVAVEILRGGETRQDINHRVKELLPPSVRTQSPKAVSNLVSSVVKRMVDCGFTVHGEWRMTPPKG